MQTINSTNAPTVHKRLIVHSDHELRDRIMQELRDAGVTRYGLHKSESKHMPSVIHPDEHIMAAVYGRINGNSAMMVATDTRLIYIDTKPLFMKMDEISYNVVSGVTWTKTPLFNTVTVHTRLGDYTLSFVNSDCARQFTHYIETNCLKQYPSQLV